MYVRSKGTLWPFFGPFFNAIELRPRVIIQLNDYLDFVYFVLVFDFAWAVITYKSGQSGRIVM